MSNKTLGVFAVIAGLSSIFIDGNIGFAVLVVPIGLCAIFSKPKKD